MNNNAQSGSERSLGTNERIDRICDLFEQAWRGAEFPKIETYLPKVPEGLRNSLLEELLAVEVELRQAAGEYVTVEEYIVRFPGHEVIVKRGFSKASAREPHTSESSTVSRLIPRSADSRRCASEQSDECEELPTQIGRFEVHKILGAGHFAVVFLAYDPLIERWVAIKKPRPERIGTPNDVANYVEEARNTAKLDHPHIVRVYDVCEMSGSLIVVQQYVEGQTLAERVNQHRLKPLAAASMVMAIGEALCHAHQQGIVHRDLKPANILVDEQDQPHVADFGLSINEFSELNRDGERAGSPAYMSPEQVRGIALDFDGRSDIWSLGVILYELLTGRRPFNGKDLTQLFEEIQRRAPRSPRMLNPEVPVELDRICLKCLEKQHTDRYASAIDLVEALRSFTCGSNISDSLPSDVRPMEKIASTFRAMISSGQLTPYLVNRTEHEYRLREALESADGSGGSRLVCCIVHGTEDQCHDTFVERLRQYTLRKCLCLEDTQPIHRYHVLFPTEAHCSDDVCQRLLVQVADQLRLPPGAKTEQLAKAILDSPCPNVIYSELATSARIPSYRPLIDAYLSFWNELLVDRLRHPTIVCLGYVYRREYGRFRKWLAAKRINRARRELYSTGFGQYERIVVTVLPELGNVTRDDADNWLQLAIGDCCLRQQLRPLVCQVFEKTPEISMEQWRSSLLTALSTA